MPADPDSYRWVEDRIRLADLDFQKHVNNAVFSVLLSNGRFEFANARLRPLIGPEAVLLVARTEIDFHAPLEFGPAVRTGTRHVRLGRTSLRIQQVILQGETHAASSETTLVHAVAGGRSSPWPESVLREFSD